MSTAITSEPLSAAAPSDANADEDSSVSSVDESMPGLVYRRVAVPPPRELEQQQQQQQPTPHNIEIVFDPPPPLEPEVGHYYDGYSSDGSMPALIPRTQMWSDMSSSEDSDSDFDVPPLIGRRAAGHGNYRAAVTRADLFDWVLPAYPSSMYIGHFHSRGRYDTESDDGCSDGGPRDCDSLEGFRAAEHTVKVLEYGDYDQYEYEYDGDEGEISEVDEDADADDEAEEEEEEVQVQVQVKLPAVGELFPQVEGNPYPLPVPEDSVRRAPQPNTPVPASRLLDMLDPFFRPPYVDAFRPEIPGMRRVPETPDDEPRVNGLVDVFWAWRDGGAGGVNRDNRPPEPEQDPDHIRDLRLRSLRRHERDLQQHQRRQESQRQRRLERRVQRQPRQPAHRHHQMRSHR